MVSLDQEAIDKAKENVLKDEQELLSRAEYFKTSKLSNKNVNAVLSLETTFARKEKEFVFDEPMQHEKEHFARYRLSKIVEDHITTVGYVVYESMLQYTGDSNKAMNALEYTIAGVTQKMKGLYP